MYGNDGRHKVAQAWIEGRAYSQGNVSTNGWDVYSYGHVVGTTGDHGQKVAYCCHYSVTTAKHCSAFKGVANICCRRHHPDYQNKASYPCY